MGDLVGTGFKIAELYGGNMKKTAFTKVGNKNNNLFGDCWLSGRRARHS